MRNIPEHVAIIMDGNRRWAKRRGLPAVAGHRQGIKAIENIMEAAKELGVKTLTMYTFSTENWKRSKREVDSLMKLLEMYLEKEYRKLVENGILLTTIGDLSKFRPALHDKIRRVTELTKDNTTLTLNLALNYGGRDEIIQAVRSIAKDVKDGKLDADHVDEPLMSRYLYTSGLKDPELLIRTGGEFRISNFLLWQLSYSELYVTKKLWPDFGKTDFKKAIMEYQHRERRMGA